MFIAFIYPMLWSLLRIPSRPARLHAALPRRFFSNQQALDVVYRRLLELDEKDALSITETQSMAVSLAAEGYSVFLHLPTGAGKSLAFQAPALMTAADKTTLVVSPLIALMHVGPSKRNIFQRLGSPRPRRLTFDIVSRIKWQL
jgi:hypothetical protein